MFTGPRRAGKRRLSRRCRSPEEARNLEIKPESPRTSMNPVDKGGPKQRTKKPDRKFSAHHPFPIHRYPPLKGKGKKKSKVKKNSPGTL